MDPEFDCRFVEYVQSTLKGNEKAEEGYKNKLQAQSRAVRDPNQPGLFPALNVNSLDCARFAPPNALAPTEERPSSSHQARASSIPAALDRCREMHRPGEKVPNEDP